MDPIHLNIGVSTYQLRLLTNPKIYFLHLLIQYLLKSSEKIFDILNKNIKAMCALYISVYDRTIDQIFWMRWGDENFFHKNIFFWSDIIAVAWIMVKKNYFQVKIICSSTNLCIYIFFIFIYFFNFCYYLFRNC